MLFANRGKRIGGVDYSDQLVNAAIEVLHGKDIVVGEAVDITAEKKYDIVISDSVFAYFQNEEYGKRVLDRMYDKALSQIALLEIFDKDMEEDCIAYRKASVENYDEKYAGLDKVFYPKQIVPCLKGAFC